MKVPPHLSQLIAKGESAKLELKRSTGELREAMQTLCAFANGKGGRVIIGVKPSGELVGQQVSEQTFHEIAAQRERFEPPIEFEVERAEVAPGRSALVLTVAGARDSVPFTFDGRAFERVANTTRKMAQERYETLLLERGHSRRRWENQAADELTLKDLDRDEVFRIVGIVRSMGRLSGPVGKSPPDVLDRVGLRKNGELLRAAVVLFGKTFLPDYPQCELRMARFRGLDKAEFLDQRQRRGPAFKLLEEAEIFCQRTPSPVPARPERPPSCYDLFSSCMRQAAVNNDQIMDNRAAISAARERYPFLTFELDLRRLPPRVWAQLGEARSKCDHLAGVPLMPATARELHALYLAKGVLATTAIEGNTLSEAQVRAVLEDKATLPPSKDYLAQEVRNVATACGAIFQALRDGGDARVTSERIRQFNAEVLRDLRVEPEVAPGRFRQHEVSVARYRAPDARFVEPLIEHLSEWLESPAFREPELRVELQLLRAIIAHLYLAWIHPFGDGNGRTARLLEFHLLIAAGVPSPAAHLLSNHYNQTRTEYYRQLDYASRSNGDVVPFIAYAVQGFVDGLAEQLVRVRAQQLGVTWESFVFDHFRGRDTIAARRQRNVALALAFHESVPIARLRSLTQDLMLAYVRKTEKTLARDLRALETAGLIVRDGTTVRANLARVEAFLPGRRIDSSPAG